MKTASSVGRRVRPLILARLASAGMTFAIPLVLARVLPLDDYGTYKQLFLISQLLYYLMPFGMAQSLYFFIPRASHPRSYFGQTLVFLMGMGALSCALIWMCAGPVSVLFDNPALREHLWAMGIYTALLMGAYPLEVGLTTQGKVQQSAVAYVVSDGLRAVLMVGAVALGFGLHGMMWALMAYAAGRWIVCWRVLTRQGGGPLFERSLFRGQLAYAIPFGVAMAISIPQQYLHQFAVSSSFSPEEFALYAVGCFQLPIVDLLYTPTTEILMVRLGELEREGRSDEWPQVLRDAVQKLAFVFLPLVVFLFVAAPDFVGALFGTKFLPAVPLFRVSVLAIVLAIFPLEGVLRAHNRTRVILVSSVVKMVASVPLVFLGIRWFGMLGAISAWVIAEFLGKGVLLAALPSVLGPHARIRALFPAKIMGKTFGAAVGAAASVVGLHSFLPDALSLLPPSWIWRVLPLAAAAGLFFVGYTSVLWLAGVQPRRWMFSLGREAAT